MDDEGIFTEEAGQFSGLDVLDDGNVAVIECLDKNSSMIMVEPYSKLMLGFVNQHGYSFMG